MAHMNEEAKRAQPPTRRYHVQLITASCHHINIR